MMAKIWIYPKGQRVLEMVMKLLLKFLQKKIDFLNRSNNSAVWGW